MPAPPGFLPPQPPLDPAVIDARWAELAPGTVAPLAQQHTCLSSPRDVLGLVEQLAQPHTSEAYLIHTGRPPVTSAVTGHTKADHGLVIAVHDGRGYAEYSDSSRHCQTLGAPDSGEWHTTRQGHFLAGSGIPVDQLAAMVIEFLTTAEVPESAQWRDLTPHSRQAHRAVS
ncbi:MAG: Imm1 family immunity protein [Pseudonocardiaceae bacterium]